MKFAISFAITTFMFASVASAQSSAKAGSFDAQKTIDASRQRMIEEQNALPAINEGEILILDRFKARVVAVTGPKECVVAIVNATQKSKFVVVDGFDTKDLTTDGAFPLNVPFKAGPTKSMGTDAYRVLKPLTKQDIEKKLEVNQFRKWKGVSGTPTYKFASADEQSGKVTLITEDGKKRLVDFKKLPKEEQEFAILCLKLTDLLKKIK